ncbi:RNA polymerase sigma factor sigB-like [Miscanthus floridulus]|uniref:RNA polymerase sigma factor sigB-like n=1 Tax=Miscanthus floridulus TaxID=154761 RepID=UPI00345B0208
MAFLAPPQFKWPPSTRAAVFREPSGGAGSRLSRINCSFSSTAVVDAERLECLSVEPPPSPHRTLPGSFGEALLNKEAVVAAAAAEAVALARAAAEVAGEVARMAQKDHPADLPRRDDTEDSFLSREVLRTEVGLEARRAGLELLQGDEFSSIFSDESEDDDDDSGHSIAVAVKSARRSERRARRVRAAMKAAKCFSSGKPVGASSTRKKRLKGCQTPLGCFYKMTGPRLLTAEQEVEFSEGIQDLLKLEAIQKEIAQYNGGEPTFSQWAAAAGTDESTLRRRLNYGAYCKNRMVKSNVRLVISIAKEHEGPGMEFSDLIQEGMQGLIRGAEKFDAKKGFRFSTYSHWWIKQAIRKSVLEQTQIIRLPAHMAEASSRVKECCRRLRRELKRLPSNEEIAVDTGMPIRRVEAAMSLPKYSVSFTSKVGCTDVTYQEIMPDTSAETAEEVLHRWLMKKDVNTALESLSTREKLVMRYRFGIEGGRPRTLHDIGQLMGVSRERIRQIELGAFRKLRSKKRVQSLQQYLQPAESW